MPKNLTFYAANSCYVPYDPLPIGLTAQLQRLVEEERQCPGEVDRRERGCVSCQN